jgi:hypothetical protein
MKECVLPENLTSAAEYCNGIDGCAGFAFLPGGINKQHIGVAGFKNSTGFNASHLALNPSTVAYVRLSNSSSGGSGGGGGLSGGAIAGIVVGALFFVALLGASGRPRLPALCSPWHRHISTSRWPGSDCRLPALGALPQLGTSPACVSINP